MAAFLNVIAILCVSTAAVKVEAKNLHVKETNTLLDDEVNLQGVYNYDDSFYTVQQDRFARHVELVTESVLEHLLQEINKRYPKANNGTNMSKMMRRLKMRLKKRMNKMNRWKDQVKREESNPKSSPAREIYKYQIS